MPTGSEGSMHAQEHKAKKAAAKAPRLSIVAAGQ
jgi:hypothetical protein